MVDRVIVSSRAGLLVFDGSYAGPELSWKVREIWDRINEDYFHRIRIHTDSHSKCLYVSIPLDDAVDCSHILVGDFQSGLDAVSIKWSLWEFPTICPAINLDLTTNNVPYLLVCQTPNIYEIKFGALTDYGNDIETIMRSAPLTADEEGGLVHFDSLRLRIRGLGSLQIKLSGEDEADQQVLVPLDLELLPGREFLRLANLVNEKCMVELKTQGGKFSINKLVLFAAPVYAERAM
jgi:hypothetical protein